MTEFADHFPDNGLAAALLPHALDAEDGAHDLAHLLRVWRNVARIAKVEGGDTQVLQAATLLHDCVALDKLSPLRSRASRLAAGKARDVLAGLGWSADLTEKVCHAIEAHSFSAGIPPETLEADILQDADRLDAMGYVGIARCLFLAGARGAAIYEPGDPRGTLRGLDERRFAMDHFRTKLLRLGDRFRTATGRELAKERALVLETFYDGLMAEVDVSPVPLER